MNWYKLAENLVVLYQGLKSNAAQSAFWTDNLAEADYYANGAEGVVMKIEIPMNLAIQYIKNVGMLPGPSPYADVFVFPSGILDDFNTTKINEEERIQAWKSLGLLKNRPNHKGYVEEELRYETTIMWGERINRDGIELPKNYIQKEYKPYDILNLEEIAKFIPNEITLMFGIDYIDIYTENSNMPVIVANPKSMGKIVYTADRIYMPDQKYLTVYLSIPFGDIDINNPFDYIKKLFDTTQAINIIINVQKINL